MDLVESVIVNPTTYRIGWALVQFVWQGAAIALLLSAALNGLRRRSANARYAAACLAMMLMLATPIANLALANGAALKTAAAEPGPEAGLDRGSAGTTTETPGAARTRGSEGIVAWRARLSRVSAVGLPWLAVAWSLGVAALSLRLIGGWMLVQRFKRRGAERLAAPWQATVDRLAEALGVAVPVKLLGSIEVHVPTVIGWLRPVILVPGSALTGLAPRQLEVILVHELAHIRRHDYLVNLLQNVVETLLFYHPATWWISRQVRVEREHCCDDLAVTACGDPLLYARALTELAAIRRRRPRLAMAADGGSLTRRVRRLVAPVPQSDGSRSAPVAVMCLAVLLVVFASARTSRPGIDHRSDRSAGDDGAAAAGLASPPRADVGAVEKPRDAVLALGGLDPVSLVAGRTVVGRPEHATEYDGFRYLFAGEACKKKFLANPRRYAVRRARPSVARSELNPRLFAVWRGRIYLFACPEERDLFLSDPAVYLAREAFEAT